jgi:ABC-2 type transport system ATP-binding protein
MCQGACSVFSMPNEIEGRIVSVILKVEGISKQYADYSLNNVSFELPEKSIMGLVGENGSGKTTILKIILNAIKLRSGTVKIFGKDAVRFEEEIKQQLGVLLDDCYFHECLDALSISKIMKPIYKNWDSRQFSLYLERFSIPVKKRINAFSKGMKAKLAIAVTLSARPRLLILDEPTSGLDPLIRNEILDIYSAYVRDCSASMLFTTHIINDLEKIASHITFIHKGSMMLSSTLEDLMNDYCKVFVSRDEYARIDKKAIISSIGNMDNSIAALVRKSNCGNLLGGFAIQNICLEDIYLFFANM